MRQTIVPVALAVLCLVPHEGFAQTTVKQLNVRVADGTVVSIPYSEGLPLPVENELFTVTNAGFGVPRPKTGTAPLTLKWIFELRLKKDVPVDSIVVEEVHQAAIPASYVRDAQPGFKAGAWLGMTDEMPAAKEVAPWLYRDENTLFIFKFTVRPRAAAEIVAYQASIISSRAKQGTLSRALEHQGQLK